MNEYSKNCTGFGIEAITCAIVASFLGFTFGPFCALSELIFL
jgi:hypothetical protein